MNVAVQDTGLPPMLVQYLEYKGRYPDCLILFQVGDFYELFFEDAIAASQALNLTLTSRDKSSPNPVPMAGVPVASVESYISRLQALNYSVAVVSQVQRETNATGMVERRLERIITPGIGLLGNLEDGAAARVVAALFVPAAFDQGAEIALAFSDVQSGKLFVREGLSIEHVAAEVARCNPAEIILPSNVGTQRFDRRNSFVRELEMQLGQSAVKFRAERYLAAEPVSGEAAQVEGFSTLSPSSRKAARLLLNYVAEVTVGLRLPIRSVEQPAYDATLAIDAVTRRTLELVHNARDGSPRATLIEYMDCTASPGGKRLLRQWTLAPQTSLAVINARLDAVEELKREFEFRNLTRQKLGLVCDIERVCARIELAVVTPRELGALRDALHALTQISSDLAQRTLGSGLINGKITGKLCARTELLSLLSQLSENPPFSLNEAGIFNIGVDSELDQLRTVRAQGKSWILELEQREREASGIASLKIKYNNLLGYFFEVSQSNFSKVPAHFVRRQSTANFERFTTDELKQREAALDGAEFKIDQIERELFLALREKLRDFSMELREIASAAALLDVLCGLAQLAEREDLKRPVLSNGNELIIKEGAHPVLAKLLKSAFVPNSIDLAAAPCAVVTGPNMGGKSTFLRQTGLIVVMAQIGSFVPAKEAHIGVVDRLFARMGASDDLAEGDSTFMLEMRETSQILRNASARSLLLVDEIGRGTATADGLAIARAVLEWLTLRLKARTLFATHFHELTRLDRRLPGIQNLSVAAIEIQGKVVFTHEIKRGAASKSYGIEVADLAGLPNEILGRARQLLNAENIDIDVDQAHSSEQLDMFKATDRDGLDSAKLERLQALHDQLLGFELEKSTPLQALNFLASLRELCCK